MKQNQDGSAIRRHPHVKPIFAGMRRYDRHMASLDVFVLDEAGWEIPFESLDISQSGVFVASPYLYEVGQEHTLVVRSKDGEVMVRAQGKVVRVERSAPGPSGMAYEFVQTDARTWKGLGEIVERL